MGLHNWKLILFLKHLTINLAGIVAFGQNSNSEIDFCKVQCILNLAFKKAAFMTFGIIEGECQSVDMMCFNINLIEMSFPQLGMFMVNDWKLFTIFD